MSKEHVISDEVLDLAAIEISKDHCWVAYNTVPYFLEPGDVYFFKTQEEAIGFTEDNVSEYDNYRILYAPSAHELMNQISYAENLEQQLHFKLNLSIMNEQNFEYLKDNIKYMGFGEKQHDVLEQNLKEGKEAFQMSYNTEVNKKPFEAVLQFRRSDSSDMYFLNSYKASLTRNNGDKVEQTFYLNKGKGVTAKEAYNLLEGRAVHKELTNKEGESYKAWLQLDFENKDKHQNNEVKQFHENYGYDLKASVAKYSIAEMDQGEKEKALLQSLQKGNIQSVTVGVNGESQRMFIEANPQYKTINIYNDKMQRLSQEQRLGLQEKADVKESNAKGVKQEVKQGTKLKADDEGSKKKRSHKKRMTG